MSELAVVFKGKQKYRAIRTTCGAGHSHPSKLEAKRCDELQLLERAGQIKRLEQQPRYPLIVNGVKIGTYVGDFRYFDNDNCILEDVKGVCTALYKFKKKLVEALYPGVKIVEVRK